MNGNGTTMQTGEAALAAAVAPEAADITAAAPILSAPPPAPGGGNNGVDCASAVQRAKATAKRKAKAKAQALVQARKAKATKTSPKVWASSLGGAIAFTFWTIATATFWKHTFSNETLAALIGSTTTIVAAAAAYFKADLLRSGD